MDFRDAISCAYFNSVVVGRGQRAGNRSDAVHCENAIDTDKLRDSLVENLAKSNSWVLNKTTNAEGADFLEARLESHDLACGEKAGHLELVFVGSERAPIVFVTGTCRFVDHARFGRFNIKIGDNRRQKFGPLR